MDYAAEQSTELESLSYIFPDELTVQDDTHFFVSVVLDLDEYDDLSHLLSQNQTNRRVDGIPLVDDDEEEDDEEEDSDEEDEDAPATTTAPQFELHFTFTPAYPEELPDIEIRKSKMLSSSDKERLLESLEDLGQQSLGMAMIFNLVSHAREEIAIILKERLETELKKREDRIAQEEAKELARFQGTRVTPTAFEEWKRAFIAEAVALKRGAKPLTKAMEAAASVELKRIQVANPNAKLTGRALFEKDTSLVKSDMQYMEEGDVSVDVTLFEGVEMMGLDDDDDEENNVLAGLTEDD